MRSHFSQEQKKIYCFFIIIFSLLFSGCGGGSDGGSPKGDAPSENVAGSWVGHFESTQGGSSGYFVMAVAQTDSILNCIADLPDIQSGIAMTGSITGGNITLTNDDGTVIMTGTANSDNTASGTYSFSFSPIESYPDTPDNGTWNAKIVETGSFEIISEIESPGMMPAGLTYDGTNLWLYSFTQNMQRISLTGKTISSFIAPNWVTVMGLTFDGTYLWLSQKDYSADSTLTKVDAEGDVFGSFISPAGEPKGLAWDGMYLYNADGVNKKIFVLDTNGSTISSFNTPGGSPHGLTFDGTYLWNSDFVSGKIFKLNKEGDLLTVYDAPGDRPTGLAFDGTYLWNADWTNGIIYQLEPH